MERGEVPIQAAGSIRLPAEPASAARARDFVRGLLRSVGNTSLEDVALLCVSELVANAAQHTDSTECVVTITDFSGDLSIEVTDQSSRLIGPLGDAPSAESEHGRGLQIVNALAGEWGVALQPDAGKSVWLRLSSG